MKFYFFFNIIFQYCTIFTFSIHSSNSIKNIGLIEKEKKSLKNIQNCLEKDINKNKEKSKEILCKTCNEGFFNHNGICVSECPLKTFANIKTKTCDIDDTQKYFITNSSGSCMNKCFDKNIKSFNSEECSCDASCKQIGNCCRDFNICIDLEISPIENKNSTSVIENCQYVSKKLSNICQKCQDSYYLFKNSTNSQCVSKCSEANEKIALDNNTLYSNIVVDESNKLCIYSNCNEKQENCIKCSNNKCIECLNGYFLFTSDKNKTTCVKNCPFNYLANKETNNCEKYNRLDNYVYYPIFSINSNQMSCSNKCGQEDFKVCSCHHTCVRFGNCCRDFSKTCNEEFKTETCLNCLDCNKGNCNKCKENSQIEEIEGKMACKCKKDYIYSDLGDFCKIDDLASFEAINSQAFPKMKTSRGISLLFDEFINKISIKKIRHFPKYSKSNRKLNDRIKAPSEIYSNSTKNITSDCEDPLCSECATNNTNKCLKCNSNAKLFDTFCDCEDGYYYDESKESCEKCHSSCNQCKESKKCYTCNIGYTTKSIIGKYNDLDLLECECNLEHNVLDEKNGECIKKSVYNHLTHAKNSCRDFSHVDIITNECYNIKENTNDNLKFPSTQSQSFAFSYNLIYPGLKSPYYIDYDNVDFFKNEISKINQGILDENSINDNLILFTYITQKYLISKNILSISENEEINILKQIFSSNLLTKINLLSDNDENCRKIIKLIKEVSQNKILNELLIGTLSQSKNFDFIIKTKDNNSLNNNEINKNTFKSNKRKTKSKSRIFATSQLTFKINSKSDKYKYDNFNENSLKNIDRIDGKSDFNSRVESFVSNHLINQIKLKIDKMYKNDRQNYKASQFQFMKENYKRIKENKELESPFKIYNQEYSKYIQNIRYNNTIDNSTEKDINNLNLIQFYTSSYSNNYFHTDSFSIIDLLLMDKEALEDILRQHELYRNDINSIMKKMEKELYDISELQENIKHDIVSLKNLVENYFYLLRYQSSTINNKASNSNSNSKNSKINNLSYNSDLTANMQELYNIIIKKIIFPAKKNLLYKSYLTSFKFKSFSTNFLSENRNSLKESVEDSFNNLNSSLRNNLTNEFIDVDIFVKEIILNSKKKINTRLTVDICSKEKIFSHIIFLEKLMRVSNKENPKLNVLTSSNIIQFDVYFNKENDISTQIKSIINELIDFKDIKEKNISKIKEKIFKLVEELIISKNFNIKILLGQENIMEINLQSFTDFIDEKSFFIPTKVQRNVNIKEKLEEGTFDGRYVLIGTLSFVAIIQIFCLIILKFK